MRAEYLESQRRSPTSFFSTITWRCGASPSRIVFAIGSEIQHADLAILAAGRDLRTCSSSAISSAAGAVPTVIAFIMVICAGPAVEWKFMPMSPRRRPLRPAISEAATIFGHLT